MAGLTWNWELGIVPGTFRLSLAPKPPVPVTVLGLQACARVSLQSALGPRVRNRCLTVQNPPSIPLGDISRFALDRKYTSRLFQALVTEVFSFLSRHPKNLVDINHHGLV